MWWLNDESLAMLERGYLKPNQSVEEKLTLICNYAAKKLNKPELSERFYEIISKGWASLSSPIWANFGEGRGLPISCFTSFAGDDTDHIFKTVHEVAMMTKNGGGTAADFSSLRPKGANVSGGGSSSGVMSFIEVFDSTIKNVSQSGVRRGGFAAYLDINHPEIKDFLRIKDKDSTLQSINNAVVVDDKFMREMIDGDKYKREVWALVLKNRREKGIPYIFFKDTANRNAPEVYKKYGKSIKSSNLCNEVMLSTDENESLVCCLSSMNLYLYDEWKDTDAVQLMIMFLDAVMTDFIEKTTDRSGFERANKFAREQRALGLGVLGWHSYLQHKDIPFDSLQASMLNKMIFKHIKEESVKASQYLAKEYGEPSLMKGTGLRGATLLAVAPTTSSASILGQSSPSIEPYKSNFYTVDLAKGSFVRKNKSLHKLLIAKGKDTKDVWDNIMFNQGSVQQLPFLNEHEKAVFKTFAEINPEAIIDQAADRQVYICQGQSLNLLIPHVMEIKEVNRLHIRAWEKGLKGLYYQRGTNATQEQLAKMKVCSSCEA